MTVRLGDVSGNGQLSMLDAALVLQEVHAQASGQHVLTADQLLAADVDGDGKITAADAQQIMDALSGKIKTFLAGPVLGPVPIPKPPLPSTTMAVIYSDVTTQTIRRVRLLAMDGGWAVLWIANRTDAALHNALAPSELWCTLLNPDGSVRAPAKHLLDIHRLDREPVFLCAWHPIAKRIGIVVNELVNYQQAATSPSSRITYQQLYLFDPQTGALTGSTVLRTDLGTHGGVGDLVPIANDPDFAGAGWCLGIETDCYFSPQHQCTWTYAVSLNGSVTRSPGLDITLKLGGAHSVNPVFAPDAATGGWICLVVRDAQAGGWAGVIVHAVQANAHGLGTPMQLVPGSFLIETDLQVAAAPDGRFAALWRERLAPNGPDFAKVQPRLVVFRRAPSGAVTVLSDHVLEPPSIADTFGDAGHFTTRLLRVADGWVACYPVLTPTVQWRRTKLSDTAGDLPLPLGNLCAVSDTASVSADVAADGTVAIAAALTRDGGGRDVVFQRLA